MTKEDQNYLEEKLAAHPVLKEWIEKAKGHKLSSNLSLMLTGGAIVDILEGRTPKDYDFLGQLKADRLFFEEMGFEFEYKTHSSYTYRKDDIVVQFLSRKKEDFEYTISATTYRLSTQRDQERVAGEGKFKIDTLAFENKILIPQSFDNLTTVYSALSRVYHWQEKGYKLPKTSYLSLLNAYRKLIGYKDS